MSEEKDVEKLIMKVFNNIVHFNINILEYTQYFNSVENHYIEELPIDEILIIEDIKFPKSKDIEIENLFEFFFHILMSFYMDLEQLNGTIQEDIIRRILIKMDSFIRWILGLRFFNFNLIIEETIIDKEEYGFAIKKYKLIIQDLTKQCRSLSKGKCLNK
jgi:hypothetical protein